MHEKLQTLLRETKEAQKIHDKQARAYN